MNIIQVVSLSGVHLPVVRTMDCPMDGSTGLWTKGHGRARLFGRAGRVAFYLDMRPLSFISVSLYPSARLRATVKLLLLFLYLAGAFYLPSALVFFEGFHG